MAALLVTAWALLSVGIYLWSRELCFEVAGATAAALLWPLVLATASAAALLASAVIIVLALCWAVVASLAVLFGRKAPPMRVSIL